MDFQNTSLQIAFSLTMIAIIVSNKIIFDYIGDKPPGLQSFFDPVLKDYLRITRTVALTFCSVGLVSRSGFLAEKIREEPAALMAVCFVYDFVIIMGCTFVFCICIVRIICITRLSVLESLGETPVRICCISISLVIATGVGLIQAIKGDTLTGPGYNLFAFQDKPSGN